jgi:hypothetical protein
MKKNGLPKGWIAIQKNQHITHKWKLKGGLQFKDRSKEGKHKFVVELDDNGNIYDQLVICFKCIYIRELLIVHVKFVSNDHVII